MTAVIFPCNRTLTLVKFGILMAILSSLQLSRLAIGAPSTGLEQLAKESNVGRLRQMFLDSQMEAIRSYHERQALAQLNDGINQTQSPGHSIHLIPLTGEAPAELMGNETANAVQKQLTKFILYRSHNSATKSDQSSNKTANEDADDDQLLKLIHKDAKDFKNDARQSSLFPGLVPQNLGNSFGFGGGNTHPLMNGAFVRPQPVAFGNLPSFQAFRLPSFQQQQQQMPPRPPKTSVIGNGGGAMALTNDNVVVVNVLSGNY